MDSPSKKEAGKKKEKKMDVGEGGRKRSSEKDMVFLRRSPALLSPLPPIPITKQLVLFAYPQFQVSCFLGERGKERSRKDRKGNGREGQERGRGGGDCNKGVR